MATQTVEGTVPVLSANGGEHKRRDLKTTINHANEELYKKQLEPKGGKEDMWQGGDMSVFPRKYMPPIGLTNFHLQLLPKSPKDRGGHNGRRHRRPGA